MVICQLRGVIMKTIIKNTIMAGINISIGAIAYLAIPNPIVASCFFAIGILLVLNFNNMLLTKVIPCLFAKIEFKIPDIVISLLGNAVGCIITGIFISATRLADIFYDKLGNIVNAKLDDNLLSLLIMAIFCGMLVGYASLASYKYKNGSFAQTFYVWLFITVFVFCGFDHVIANIFYFTCYAILFNFDLSMLLILLVIFVGNFIGGMLIGLAEKDKVKEL